MLPTLIVWHIVSLHWMMNAIVNILRERKHTIYADRFLFTCSVGEIQVEKIHDYEYHMIQINWSRFNNCALPKCCLHGTTQCSGTFHIWVIVPVYYRRSCIHHYCMYEVENISHNWKTCFFHGMCVMPNYNYFNLALLAYYILPAQIIMLNFWRKKMEKLTEKNDRNVNDLIDCFWNTLETP